MNLTQSFAQYQKGFAVLTEPLYNIVNGSLAHAVTLRKNRHDITHLFTCF